MLRIKLESVKEKDILKWISEGKIFLYPTDTVYGLGCDAENREAIERLRGLKGARHPLSVIAPSKRWIIKNLFPHPYLNLLPGPYTLILLKRNPKFLRWASAGRGLAVRIPKHPLTRIIQKSGKPFITTSANLSGQPVIRKPEELKLKVDIVIDAGELSGKPSQIIDLTQKTPKIIRR